MAKRGQNEGTITKRADGRWEARATLPDGKRKCIYGKTQKEVLHKLNKIKIDVEQGLPIAEEKQTVAQYLDSWLETVKHQLRATSYRRYSDHVRLRLVPYIGKTPLAKLTPQQVQKVYSTLMTKGVSPTTVEQLHVVLHKALKDAMRLGLVQRNITDVVNSPRARLFEIHPYSEEQVRLFLQTAQGDRFEALFTMAVATGMRLGELLALRWEDVDFERAYLFVRATLQRDGNMFVLSEPKTARSRRNIALPETVLDALHAHQQRQVEEHEQLGEAWENTLNLVFPNSIGKPMKPSNLTQLFFARILRKAGLPRIRFHDLRHSAATLLLGRGVHPKVVSEMLGHSQISITLDVYSHVTPHMQQSAAAAMDAVLKDKES